MQLQGRPTSWACVNKVLTTGLFCSANNRETALLLLVHDKYTESYFLSANKRFSLQLEDPLNCKYFYKKTEKVEIHCGGKKNKRKNPKTLK